MPDAVQDLAESVRLLLQEFGAGKPEPQQAREQALRAVASAGRAYAEGVGLSGSVVIAQVRTTASEVIRATGLNQEQANQLIRQAFGDRRPDRAHPRVPRVPQAAAGSGRTRAGLRAARQPAPARARTRAADADAAAGAGRGADRLTRGGGRALAVNAGRRCGPRSLR